jgi:predicted pyridoxine 5'-phosphate oxidase superfamily flavin-nucleotide-binding protein
VLLPTVSNNRMHRTFNDIDRELIETAHFFFLASAWQESVDCSMKGGRPGFVRVTAPNEIAWPDYDGNRMYRSQGNMIRSPAVGLRFVASAWRASTRRGLDLVSLTVHKARIDDERGH